MRDEPRIAEAFRSGAGVGWHEHNPDVFAGCERFFRPGYAANLAGAWIPGAQAGEAGIRQVVTSADFSRFRRAAETPFNLVYEARP